MKQIIDHLDDVSGWIVNAPSTIEIIEFPELIAGLNNSSLQIKFDSGDLTRVITKSISPTIDVSGYETLIFSIWSNKYGNSIQYQKPEQFAYKITLDGIHEYYIPIYKTFQDISIGIEDVNSISEITITALHTETDHIVISEMIAENEETNYDVLVSIKEAIEFDVYAVIGNGVLLSSGFSGTTGDTLLSFSSGVESLDRYAVIKIKEGVLEEIHQIGNNTETGFTMLTLFDGAALINNYSSAEIYLQYPVIINPTEQEAQIPGISIWGVSPEEIFQDFKLTNQFDTVELTGEFKGRGAGQHLEYPVLIDCEAREYNTLAKISSIVRKWIGKEIVWINGRKHDVSPAGPAVEIRPTEGINIIPKNQYNLTVNVVENLFDRQNIPAVTSINTTVIPERR